MTMGGSNSSETGTFKLSSDYLFHSQGVIVLPECADQIGLEGLVDPIPAISDAFIPAFVEDSTCGASWGGVG